MPSGIIKQKKKNKQKGKVFTVVCNWFIELIAARCPGGQKEKWFPKGSR